MSIANCSGMLRCDFGPDAEHPDFPLADWQHAVITGATREGYYDWLEDQLDQRDDYAAELRSAYSYA